VPYLPDKLGWLSPHWVCAVIRRRSSVGASPTRQLSLQPEAIGAVMEVTKWLKPSVYSVSRIGEPRFQLRVVCHEYRRSKRRCATVREMKEGPSGSAIRS